MMPVILQAGLAAGYLTYLLTQSSSAPVWWSTFRFWWQKVTPWGGKPFSCMICMSFWFALLFLLPSYGVSVFYVVTIPCTSPLCVESGVVNRYIFEVTNALTGLALGTFSAAGISVLMCYVIDKLSMTFITTGGQK